MGEYPRVIDRLDRLRWWQVILFLAAVAAILYVPGVGQPFQGDDLYQIVNATPVHSLANIGRFFTGGTFYYGQGNVLQGGWYRPLTVTLYSLIYTVAGANPVWFHVAQLILSVCGSSLLYLFLRRFFKPALAAVLALVFVVHPINSQGVLAIPSMDEPLFFALGMAAQLSLARSRSLRALPLTAALLVLSLLAKETGAIFIASCLLYLWIWDRRRVMPLVLWMAIPGIVYLLLRSNAVGLVAMNANNGPIARLDFGGRVLTIPSILLFYIGKFLFPVQLASRYYWVHPNLSVGTFWIPLIVDAAVVALFVNWGMLIRRCDRSRAWQVCAFFSGWTVVALVPHLQLFALDQTVSEPWFLMPMAGVLGMAGVAGAVLLPRAVARLRIGRAVAWKAGVLLAGVVLVLLAARTEIRTLALNAGQLTIMKDEVAASPSDFTAEIVVAYQQAKSGQLDDALQHARHAVQTFPESYTYDTLGKVLLQRNDYAGAHAAFASALAYDGANQLVYDDLGVLTVWYGNPVANREFLSAAVAKFPHDGQLWLDLAILDENHGNNADARTEIAIAAQNGANAVYSFNQILAGQPIVIASSHPELQ